MHSKIVAFLLPVLALANPFPQAAPAELTVSSFYVGGNGCPEGTFTTKKSESITTNVGYKQFEVTVDPTTPSNKWSMKYCTLTFYLKYPKGVQYTVASASYSGYAKLDKGMTANFDTAYFFSQDGSPKAISSSRTTISGGGAISDGQVFTKQDEFDGSSLTWSPCTGSATLNVDQRIEVSSAVSGNGEISVYGATVPLELKTRSCIPN